MKGLNSMYQRKKFKFLPEESKGKKKRKEKGKKESSI